MGTKYSSQTQSGYNAAPPPDDGSTAANNLESWAGVKTKLSDPVLTLAQNINTALLTALDFGGRSTAISDTATVADHMRTIECTSGGITMTIPTASGVGAGFTVNYKNSSTGIVTVILQTGTDTLDGVVNGSQAIQSGQSVTFKTNTAATGHNTISNYEGSSLGQSSRRQTALSGPIDITGAPCYLPQAVTGLTLTSQNIAATDTIITGNVTTAVASPGVVGWTGHPLVVNQAISFTTSGALPTGLTAGVTYYVIATGLTANQFEVAATPGGAAINFTGSTSGQSVCWGGEKLPLVVCAASGVGSTGEINIIGSTSNNLTWTSLANTTTNYLYVLVSNGGLTTGFTTLAPIITSGITTAPSITSGQITHNTTTGISYLGNGSTAPQTNLVVLGTATTAGGNITATNIYPYGWSKIGGSGLGCGQTWQDVTGSRVSGTTYYNTTSKPIQIYAAGSSGLSVIVNGTTITPAVTGVFCTPTFTVPVEQSYSITGTFSVWVELR